MSVGRRQRLDQAWARHRSGDLEFAYATYVELLREEPDDASALHYLGVLAQQTGRTKTAVDLIRRSLEIEPGNARALDDLGQIHASRKQLREATACFRQALAIDPNAARTLNNLANVLRLSDPQEALDLYRRALASDPALNEAHYNLGKLLRDLRMFDEAVQAFEQSIRTGPGNYRAHYELALCCEELGRFAAAHDHYVSALRVEPQHARSLANLLGLPSFEPDAELLQRALVLASSSQVNPEARAKLHQGLGKHYDRCGHFRAAFGHFAQSNAIQKQWLAAKVLAPEDFTAAAARFDAEHFAAVRGLGNPSRRPVFIVGMPRSGTTLVEQILASHPLVHGGGELPDMSVMAGAAHVADAGSIATAAQRYLQQLEQISPAQAERVTNKLPTNYRHLGLIATLFPGAHIIHCRRDPRDVALSCFIEMFAIRDQDFTDLAGIARAIALESRWMRHWRAALPLAIHEVDYQALVQNLESEGRRLIEHCGLPWSDRCLQFFATQRHVDTPSRWQVRQPIYASSVGRWRNYAEQLQPAIALLRAAEVLPPDDC